DKKVSRRTALAAGAKAGIAIGAVVVVGGAGYLAYTSENRATAPPTTTTSGSSSTTSIIPTSTTQATTATNTAPVVKLLNVGMPAIITTMNILGNPPAPDN